MEKVVIRISPHLHIKHSIYLDEIDPSTYAASLLLNDYYRDLDVSYSENDDWRFLFIVKRTFLRHRKQNGKWICHYCGKEIFKMAQRNKRSQDVSKCVTVDHKIPACKHPDKTDSSNFLVSCYKCNKDKEDKDYEVFKNESKAKI